MILNGGNSMSNWKKLILILAITWAVAMVIVIVIKFVPA